MINLFKNFLNEQLYAISLYFKQLAGTIVLLLVVRFLSVYDYGLFASYNNIAAFLFMIANLGYAEYILVSSKKNITEVQEKIGFFNICAVILGLFYIAVSQVIPLESKLLFSLILISTYFNSTFFGLILPYFQSANKFKIISYVNIFYSIMQILIASICYWCSLNLLSFLGMCILVGIINFIQCSYYAKLNYTNIIKNFKNIFNKIDKSIFVYAGSSLVFWIYNQIPSLYVATFIQKEEAALFFSAFAISNLIIILMSAQYQKMIPEMISAPIYKIKKIINNNLIFMLSIDFVFLVTFMIFGKNIILLVYSKEYYINALPYVILLTLGNIAITFASVYGAYMTASGHQNLKLKIMSVASVITIISIFTCYKFGLYAAIIAYVLSAFFMGCTYFIQGMVLLKKQEREESFGE